MTDFDEILGAFEEALELERELGTRTVECDRALLVPMRPAPPPAPRAPEAGAQPKGEDSSCALISPAVGARGFGGAGRTCGRPTARTDATSFCRRAKTSTSG